MGGEEESYFETFTVHVSLRIDFLYSPHKPCCNFGWNWIRLRDLFGRVDVLVVHITSIISSFTFLLYFLGVVPQFYMVSYVLNFQFCFWVFNFQEFFFIFLILNKKYVY